MSPCKVLHVIPSIGVARGGPSFVIRTLAAAQAKLGAEVHVAATDDNGSDSRTPPPSLPFHEQNVAYWIFPRQSRFYSFSWPLTTWLARRVCDYDVVHIHALFSYPVTAAAQIAARAHIPYIVRPLGTLSRWGIHNRRRALKRWSYRMIESGILKAAAAVQYTSEQEAAEANELGVPQNGVIIPNPVDISNVNWPRCTEQGGPILLFLSRLDQMKGVALLLEAFARLKTTFPAAKLVIAGDGPHAVVQSLRAQLFKLGIESEVTWAGFAQGEAKSRLFAQADVFVLPSYSENFGVAVVEAMGAGLPVVVSNRVGLHRQIQTVGAGLVCECTVESLQSALCCLLHNPELRVRMGKQGTILAGTFSGESVAKQLAELYASIGRKHNASAAA